MPLQVEDTTFSRDFIGRYLCNTWEEALNSTNTPLDPAQFSLGSRSPASYLYPDGCRDECERVDDYLPNDANKQSSWEIGQV